MSFSNYPRTGDVANVVVPAEQLERFVRLAFIWGSFMTIAGAVLLAVDQSFFREPNWESNPASLIASGGSLLFSLLLGIIFAMFVHKWVRLAWDTTVRARSLEPRISANAAAWLSVIPIINLLALVYIMDFLVIRSRSSEARTMGPFSVASGDPLATWFCYLLCTQFFMIVISFFPTFSKLFNTEGLLFSSVDFLIQLICFLLGYKLSKQVNHQLSKSVRPVI